MNFALRFFVFFGVALSGCAGGSSGVGGAGGSGSTSTSASSSKASGTTISASSASTTSTTASTTSSVTASSSTGMAPCDTGAHGSLDATATPAQMQICQACVACSQSHMCKTQWAAFAADPNASAYTSCVQACASDQACIANCASMYPNADTLLGDALVCSVCTECMLNCDATATCV